MGATRPTQEIDGCRAAHRGLIDGLAGLDEATARRPSLLPDWTVAHVLGHLVGNADSVVRRLSGAVEDRVVDQYPGGSAGRSAEIERLAALPVRELLAAVRRSCAQVEAILELVPDDAWDRESRSVEGRLAPAARVVWSRWREVEVHRTDLGLGYPASAWPAALVARWLPDVLGGLPQRADPAELLAWAVGRGPAPALLAWG